VWVAVFHAIKVDLFEKAVGAQLAGVAKQVDVVEAKTATLLAHFEVGAPAHAREHPKNS
jgi:hypothetical protein